MFPIRLQPKMLVRFSDGLRRILTTSELSLSYARFGFLGHQILKHSLHSSSGEDVFSELDLPPEGPGARLNLATEQFREPRVHSRQNMDIVEKAVSDIHMGEDNVKSITPTRGKHSLSLSSAVENQTGISRIKNTVDSTLYVNPNSVTIAKVPTTISLAQVRKSISEFGEVSNASVRSDQSGFNIYDVEFKTLKSKERALASGGINVKSSHLPIYSLSAPENITIRISNMEPDTTEPAIHTTCMRCGPVEGLFRTNNRSVDVVFRVKDLFAAKEIVDKLDGVCVDKGWSAEILTDSTAATVVDSGACPSQVQEEAGSELSSALEDFRRQYEVKKIFLDDLVFLHQAVVHLQSRPT